MHNQCDPRQAETDDHDTLARIDLAPWARGKQKMVDSGDIGYRFGSQSANQSTNSAMGAVI
jgi:hypothetical protein